MPRPTLLRLVPVLFALSVGVAACGGSDDPEPVDATVARPRTTATQTTPTTATTTTPTVTTPTADGADSAAADDAGRAAGRRPRRRRPTTRAARPSPNEQPSTTPQQSGGASTPASCGSVAGGFISGVQATGADCGEAAGVASAWLDAIGESGPDADVAAGGYACSGALDGQKTSVTCIADGGRARDVQRAAVIARGAPERAGARLRAGAAAARTATVDGRAAPCRP